MPTASWTVTPNTPNHGDTITATYTVTGNDGTPAGTPNPGHVTGTVTVGDQVYQLDAPLTTPGAPATPPAPVTYATPSGAGLTFKQDPANPAKWTAIVP